MSPIKILVVDDEPPMVELVRGYLAREGWEVLTARDGNEALEMQHSGGAHGQGIGRAIATQVSLGLRSRA